MKEEDKVCARCKYFQRYYKKGVKRFISTSVGFCCHFNKQMPVMKNCENFSPTKYSKKSYEVIRMYLDLILSELETMQKTIEAEVDEQENLQDTE